VVIAMINGHDFVVVETIECTDDKDEELPQLITLEEVIRLKYHGQDCRVCCPQWPRIPTKDSGKRKEQRQVLFLKS
jgi:hypothetical protein